jgi:hypothetical protein
MTDRVIYMIGAGNLIIVCAMLVLLWRCSEVGGLINFEQTP